MKKKEINYFVGNKLDKYGLERVINTVELVLMEIDDLAPLNPADIKTIISHNINKLLRSPNLENKIAIHKSKPEYEHDNLEYLKPEKTGKSVIILGSSGSGKTTLLCKMLEKVKKKDYFKVVIFTESENSEPFKILKKEKPFIRIFNCFVPKIVNFIKLINEVCDNKFKFLIILDDITDLRTNIINRMMLFFRNSNIVSVILTQYTKLLTPAVRGSAWYTIIRNLRPADLENVVRIYGLKKSGKTIPQTAREYKDLLEGYDKILVLDNRHDKENIKTF